MQKGSSKNEKSMPPETAAACVFEGNVKNLKTWEEIPPVVFSKGKPLSTAGLKENYKKMHEILDYIARQPEWAGGNAIELARKTLAELEKS